MTKEREKVLRLAREAIATEYRRDPRAHDYAEFVLVALDAAIESDDRAVGRFWREINGPALRPVTSTE